MSTNATELNKRRRALSPSAIEPPRHRARIPEITSLPVAAAAGTNTHQDGRELSVLQPAKQSLHDQLPRSNTFAPATSHNQSINTPAQLPRPSILLNRRLGKHGPIFLPSINVPELQTTTQTLALSKQNQYRPDMERTVTYTVEDKDGNFRMANYPPDRPHGVNTTGPPPVLQWAPVITYNNLSARPPPRPITLIQIKNLFDSNASTVRAKYGRIRAWQSTLIPPGTLEMVHGDRRARALSELKRYLEFQIMEHGILRSREEWWQTLREVAFAEAMNGVPPGPLVGIKPAPAQPSRGISYEITSSD